jgi:hypothetical protein
MDKQSSSSSRIIVVNPMVMNEEEEEVVHHQQEAPLLNRAQNEKQKKLEEMKLKYPELFQEEITEDDDDDVCPICLELFTNENPALPCDCTHQFHFQCVEEWLQRSGECPVCYKKLKYDLMSSEEEVAYARHQLGYHSPQQIHNENNNRLNNGPPATSNVHYDLQSFFRDHAARHAASHRAHLVNNNNNTIAPPPITTATTTSIRHYNRIPSSTTTIPTPRVEQRPRSRSVFGKLFDKLNQMCSSLPSMVSQPTTTVPANNASRRSRRSQTVF